MLNVVMLNVIAPKLSANFIGLKQNRTFYEQNIFKLQNFKYDFI